MKHFLILLLTSIIFIGCDSDVVENHNNYLMLKVSGKSNKDYYCLVKKNEFFNETDFLELRNCYKIQLKDEFRTFRVGYATNLKNDSVPREMHLKHFDNLPVFFKPFIKKINNQNKNYHKWILGFPEKLIGKQIINTNRDSNFEKNKVLRCSNDYRKFSGILSKSKDALLYTITNGCILCNFKHKTKLCLKIGNNHFEYSHPYLTYYSMITPKGLFSSRYGNYILIEVSKRRIMALKIKKSKIYFKKILYGQVISGNPDIYKSNFSIIETKKKIYYLYDHIKGSITIIAKLNPKIDYIYLNSTKNMKNIMLRYALDDEHKLVILKKIGSNYKILIKKYSKKFDYIENIYL